MKIVHCVSKRLSDQQRELLAESGISIRSTGADSLVGQIDTFEISEDHPIWDSVLESIIDSNAVDVIKTHFTVREREQSKYHSVGARHLGYPMPDDDFGYRSNTYSDQVACWDCGISGDSIAPFRLDTRTKRKFEFFQLHWVYDELFVESGIGLALSEKLGLGYTEVLDHETGTSWDEFVQMRIPDNVSVAHSLTGHGTSKCRTCGRLKYDIVNPGYFPSVDAPMNGHIARTLEYFGSGGKAFRAIIVSAEFYHFVTKAKWKGLEFRPLA